MLLPREMVPFELECFAESEFDEQPDDETAAVGVAISGRYFPTFADYKDAHGTLSPMVFNDESRDGPSKPSFRSSSRPSGWYESGFTNGR